MRPNLHNSHRFEPWVGTETIPFRSWRRTMADIGLSAWLIVVFPFVRLIDFVDDIHPPCRLWPALRQVWTEAR